MGEQNYSPVFLISILNCLSAQLYVPAVLTPC